MWSTFSTFHSSDDLERAIKDDDDVLFECSAVNGNGAQENTAAGSSDSVISWGDSSIMVKKNLWSKLHSSLSTLKDSSRQIFAFLSVSRCDSRYNNIFFPTFHLSSSRNSHDRAGVWFHSRANDLVFIMIVPIYRYIPDNGAVWFCSRRMKRSQHCLES